MGEMARFLSILAVVLTCLCCPSLTSGHVKRKIIEKALSNPEIHQKVNNTAYVLILFCEDPKKEECVDISEEITMVLQDPDNFPELEAVMTTDVQIIEAHGVSSLPRVLFFRNSKPILFDTEDYEYTDIANWMEQHKEVRTIELNDDSFEHDTQATSGATTGDWFVMFYDTSCSHYIAAWESLASWLLNEKVVAKVDLSTSPLVQERFQFTKCLNFLLFSRGKMYEYTGSLTSSTTLATFAKTGFKAEEGKVIPPEIGLLYTLYLKAKPHLNPMSPCGRCIYIVGGAILIIILIAKAIKSKRAARAKFD